VDVTEQRYGEAYYASGLGPDPYRRDDRWLAFFNGVAREIVLALAPRRVYDAGCAMGMLVESLWDLGVEAHGVDVSSYAISQVRPDMRPYCRVGSVTQPPEGRYDLVTCIEVLEHVDADEAERAVAALADAADAILFSSTPSDFEEPTHVNVRPPIAWIRAFAVHGFRVDLRFDATFLSPQAMLLRRAERYADDAVEELYAHHVLIRSALIERERRIGQLNAQCEDVAAKARADVEAARVAHEAEVAAARNEADAARAEAERTRTEAAEIAARAGAERGALAVLRGRLAEAHAERDAARASASAAAAALAAGEHRVHLAGERAALALLRLGESDSAAETASPSDESDTHAFAELARRYASLEARYRRAVADDIALFEAEAGRLSGY
jgi:hypothetical protein